MAKKVNRAELLFVVKKNKWYKTPVKDLYLFETESKLESKSIHAKFKKVEPCVISRIYKNTMIAVKGDIVKAAQLMGIYDFSVESISQTEKSKEELNIILRRFEGNETDAINNNNNTTTSKDSKRKANDLLYSATTEEEIEDNRDYEDPDSMSSDMDKEPTLVSSPSATQSISFAPGINVNKYARLNERLEKLEKSHEQLKSDHISSGSDLRLFWDNICNLETSIEEKFAKLEDRITKQEKSCENATNGIKELQKDLINTENRLSESVKYTNDAILALTNKIKGTELQLTNGLEETLNRIDKVEKYFDVHLQRQSTTIAELKESVTSYQCNKDTVAEDLVKLQKIQEDTKQQTNEKLDRLYQGSIAIERTIKKVKDDCSILMGSYNALNELVKLIQSGQSALSENISLYKENTNIQLQSMRDMVRQQQHQLQQQQLLKESSQFTFSTPTNNKK